MKQKKAAGGLEQMPGAWLQSVTEPKQSFATEVNNAGYARGLAGFIVSGLISGIGSSLLSLVIATPAAILAAPLAIAYSLGAAVILPFILLGMNWLIAKLLGGQGGFKQLYYLVSLYQPAIAVVSLVPLVNIVAWIYAVYLLVLALKESQKLSTGRAIAAILIPFAIVLVLVLFVALIFFGALLSVMSSVPK